MESAVQLRKRVLLVLIVMALVSSLWAVWHTGDWEGLALNFGTEMVGAVVTYILLELVIGGMEEREAKRGEREAKKVNLIAQLGSRAQDVAIAASEELARLGWLYDGSLQGAPLAMANLQRANLDEANLQGASLSGARLQGAYLARANLQGAVLLGANLQGASLSGARLQGAYLNWVNLQGAYLVEANLQGAFLLQANLQGAEFDEDTIVPDGTKWTPGTDMARFTHPDHPDFWRPMNSGFELA